VMLMQLRRTRMFCGTLSRDTKANVVLMAIGIKSVAFKVKEKAL
ncbi:MAG: hypothetical protein FD128_541, partial [Hyphomonadaceae bacterium]